MKYYKEHRKILKSKDDPEHSTYSNPALEHYEVDGQMNIFDFLNTQPESSK